MKPEESEEAVRILVNLVEELLAENAAQRMAISLLSKRRKRLDRKTMQFFMKDAKEKIIKSRSEIFSWLRDMILSSVSDTHPQPPLLPRWEEELRRLVDNAAKGADLSE